MKTFIKFPIIFIVIVLPYLLYGQGCPNNDLVLVFDANTRTFISPKWRVKSGKDISVQVININPYLFDAEINVDGQYFEQNAPSLPENILAAITGLKDLPVAAPGGIFNIPGVILKSAAAGENEENIPTEYGSGNAGISPRQKNGPETSLFGNTISNQYSGILKKASILQGEYPGVLKYILGPDYTACDCEVHDECKWQKEVGVLLAETNNLKISCLEYLEKDKGDKDSYLAAVAAILKALEEGEITKTFSTMAAHVDEIKSAQKIWQAYKSVMDEITIFEERVMSLNDIDMTSHGSTTGAWLRNGNDIKRGVYNTQLQQLDNFNLLCIRYIHDHKALNSPYLEAVKNIKKNLDEGKLKKIFRDFHHLLMNYHQSLFTFSSIPMEAKGDQVKINIKIKPRDSTNHPALRAIDLERTVDVCGYWQPSFSSGFFLSKVTDELYVQTTDVSNGDTTYVLLPEGNNSWDVGINALTHYAYKISPGFALGIHIGAGLVIKDKPTLQLLGGGSMVLGKRNRWAINAGAAVGRRDVLLDNLDVNTGYPVPVEKAIKKRTDINWQLSVTYNFSP
ncbi:MAG TPA: hypothetical protein ENJ95_09685 [Bacteroidetes bacterium]|nr:hypothetical protein [Bacteroidota bacterium]